MTELYGDLPLVATKEIVDICKSNDLVIGEFWASFGKFLYDYYGKDERKQLIDDTSKLIKKSYDDQHHSGYSHLVVTQCIMEFLSGKMKEKDKERILGTTKQKEGKI